MNIIVTDYFDISYAGECISDDFDSQYIIIKPSTKSEICVAIPAAALKSIYGIHGELLLEGNNPPAADVKNYNEEDIILIRTKGGVSYKGIPTDRILENWNKTNGTWLKTVGNSMYCFWIPDTECDRIFKYTRRLDRKG